MPLHEIGINVLWENDDNHSIFCHGDVVLTHFHLGSRSVFTSHAYLPFGFHGYVYLDVGVTRSQQHLGVLWHNVVLLSSHFSKLPTYGNLPRFLDAVPFAIVSHRKIEYHAPDVV